VVSDNTIKLLLQKSSIINAPQNFLQSKRCAQVISLALIKCDNYKNLKDSLMTLTGLSDLQTWKGIKKYIPFLINFNPNINVNRWLPSIHNPNPPITYEDCVEIAEESDKNIRFAMTLEEFNNAMENRGDKSPNKTPLKWACKFKGHEWWTAYNQVSRGTGCPFCYGNNPITYEDCVKIAEEYDKGIKFVMTREEFNNAMENRGDKTPNKTPLKWACKFKGHEWWTTYNSILMDSGCPFCYGNNPITYEDCVKIAEESDKGIKFVMTREEFNNAMENRGDKTPNKVSLKWACKFKGHEWWTTYNIIYKGSGCPFCGERKGVIGKLSHPILEYFSIILFKLKDCSIQHETYLNSNSYEFIDLMIERNKNFINNFENSQIILNIPSYITQILIDFTLSFHFNSILDKCYKEYQNETRFLIIVLYSKENKNLLQEFQNSIQNSREINFKKNIKVIDFYQYLNFFYLIIPIDSRRILSEDEKIILQKFTYVIDLILDAMNSDEKLDELIKLSDYCEQQLLLENKD